MGTSAKEATMSSSSEATKSSCPGAMVSYKDRSKFGLVRVDWMSGY